MSKRKHHHFRLPLSRANGSDAARCVICHARLSSLASDADYFGASAGMWKPGVDFDSSISSDVMPSAIPSNKGDDR